MSKIPELTTNALILPRVIPKIIPTLLIPIGDIKDSRKISNEGLFMDLKITVSHVTLIITRILSVKWLTVMSSFMVAISTDIAKNRAPKLTDAISVRKFQPRSNLTQNPNRAPRHGHSTSFIYSAEISLEGFPGNYLENYFTDLLELHPSLVDE